MPWLNSERLDLLALFALIVATLSICFTGYFLGFSHASYRVGVLEGKLTAELERVDRLQDAYDFTSFRYEKLTTYLEAQGIDLPADLEQL